MKYFFTLLLFGISLIAISQNDTTMYLGVNGKLLVDGENALRYEKLEKVDDSKYILSFFSKKDEEWKEDKQHQVQKVSENNYLISCITCEIQDTIIRVVKDTMNLYLIIDYYSNGSVNQVGYSKLPFPLNKTFTWITYYENGNKKSQEVYSNNQMTSNLRWDEYGKEDISNVFSEAEIMPKYGKGDIDNFRSKVAMNLRYPESAAENGIQGKVLTEFIIMEDGSMEGIRITKNVHPTLDLEAYRVLSKMPAKWAPGYINGKPVRVKITFPLVFILQ